MNNLSWLPTFFEDRLLYKYLGNNPGKLFLEVRVGGSKNNLHARRIDTWDRYVDNLEDAESIEW